MLHWLRAGRESDGDKCEVLHALAFHMNRSTTHKVNCVLISILSLLSTLATHDKVSGIVKACTSCSITGETLTYGDRNLEYLNYLQEQRNATFASFDRALHYSDEIIALLHVRQAWEEAKYGQTRIHDPLKQSTLNAAEVIRQKLRAELTTDLTVATDRNPFFHTGNPVKLNAGPRRSYRLPVMSGPRTRAI